MNRKAQGLSLEYIVIAALAALVLIIGVAFTISGSSTFLTQILGAGPDDIQVARSTCNNLCQQSQGVLNDEEWDNSAFCQKSYDIDLNKNNQKEESEIGIRCYSDTINAKCTSGSSNLDGDKIVCDHDACGEDDCDIIKA